MDAFTASNLEDTLRLEKNPEDTSEQNWEDESNGVWSDKVLFDTRHQVSCVIQNIWKAVVGDPGEEISDKKYRVAFAIEEEVSLLSDEERTLH